MCQHCVNVEIEVRKEDLTTWDMVKFKQQGWKKIHREGNINFF